MAITKRRNQVVQSPAEILDGYRRNWLRLVEQAETAAQVAGILAITERVDAGIHAEVKAALSAKFGGEQ
jgi:hypothetical protein